MTGQRPRRTAAQDILIAAADLANRGKPEFTEWDLTVAAWQRDPNRFGLRGFEASYPDHKRVMMEIMGQSKKDNPIRRRFFEKTRPNHYRLTALGAAEAAAIQGALEGGSSGSAASPMTTYVALEPLIESPPFRAWLKDPEEPRTWLGAAAFLGLSKNTANELHDRVRALETAVRRAKEWCTSVNRETLTRGVDGGSKSIPLIEINNLLVFLEVLKTRFARQMAAIRQRDN